MNKAEIWKQVPSEPQIEVSNLGNARFADGGLPIKKHVKKTCKKGTLKNYVYTRTKGGCPRPIDKLIAQAFLEGDHYRVVHTNGDTLDDRADNIKWYVPKGTYHVDGSSDRNFVKIVFPNGKIKIFKSFSQVKQEILKIGTTLSTERIVDKLKCKGISAKKVSGVEYEVYCAPKKIEKDRSDEIRNDMYEFIKCMTNRYGSEWYNIVSDDELESIEIAKKHYKNIEEWK